MRWSARYWLHRILLVSGKYTLYIGRIVCVRASALFFIDATQNATRTNSEPLNSMVMLISVGFRLPYGIPMKESLNTAVLFFFQRFCNVFTNLFTFLNSIFSYQNSLFFEGMQHEMQHESGTKAVLNIKKQGQRGPRHSDTICEKNSSTLASTFFLSSLKVFW